MSPSDDDDDSSCSSFSGDDGARRLQSQSSVEEENNLLERGGGAVVARSVRRGVVVDVAAGAVARVGGEIGAVAVKLARVGIVDVILGTATATVVEGKIGCIAAAGAGITIVVSFASVTPPFLLPMRN